MSTTTCPYPRAIPTADALVDMGYVFALTSGEPPNIAGAVMPHAMGGGARLHADCDQWGCRTCYDYTSVAEAKEALIKWLTLSIEPRRYEPSGWIRCVNDGRRRPDKSVASEYVRP